MFHFENVTALTTVFLRHTETIIPQFKEILIIYLIISTIFEFSKEFFN